MELLIKSGINHIDTAASYGDSEDHLGPWMERERSRFFLATKTGERTYEAAKAQIRKSLERLRVPSVDLIQLHNLAQEDEWEVAMGPDGALRAAVLQDGRELLSADVRARYRLSGTSTVQASLSALVREDVLAREGSRYTVVDSLFREWVARRTF